jgi:hypothetical protein
MIGYEPLVIPLLLLFSPIPMWSPCLA